MTPQREAELLEFFGAKIFFICREEKKLPWLDKELLYLECTSLLDWPYEEESKAALEKLLGPSIIERHKLAGSLGGFIQLTESLTLQSSGFQNDYYDCLRIAEKEQDEYINRYVPPSELEHVEKFQNKFDVVPQPLSEKESKYIDSRIIKRKRSLLFIRCGHFVLVSSLVGVVFFIFCYKLDFISVFYAFEALVYLCGYALLFKKQKDYRYVKFNSKLATKIKIKRCTIKPIERRNKLFSKDALSIYFGVPQGLLVDKKFYVYFPKFYGYLDFNSDSYSNSDFKGELELINTNFAYYDGRPIYYGLSLKTDKINYSIKENYKNRFYASKCELVLVQCIFYLFLLSLFTEVANSSAFEYVLNNVDLMRQFWDSFTVSHLIKDIYLPISLFLTPFNFFILFGSYVLFLGIRHLFRLIYLRRYLRSLYDELPYYMIHQYYKRNLFQALLSADRAANTDKEAISKNLDNCGYASQLSLVNLLNKSLLIDNKEGIGDVDFYKQSFIKWRDCQAIYLKITKNTLKLPLVSKSLFLLYFKVVYWPVSLVMWLSVVDHLALPFLAFVIFVMLCSFPHILNKVLKFYSGYVVFDRDTQLVSFPNSIFGSRVYIPYNDVKARMRHFDDFDISELLLCKIPEVGYKKRSYYFGSNCIEFDKGIWSKIGGFMTFK